MAVQTVNRPRTATSGGAYDVGIARADGGHLANAVLSNRYYLADADFLVGLEGDDSEVLAGIQAALRSPHRQLCLSRKSFVPSLPVYLPYAGGLRDGGLEDVFLGEPPPPTPGASLRRRAQSPVGLRAVIERKPGATEETRMDQPFADSFATRRFGPRWVETTFLKPPGDTAE